MYKAHGYLKMAVLFSFLCVFGIAQAVVVVAEKTSSLQVENKEITCWRCPNKTSNDNCNEWAPDIPCEKNHTVCQTVHQLDIKTGKSLWVNKRCAKPEHCTVDMIGCQNISPTTKECISCCNFAYCNEPVPTNHSTAMLYSSIVMSSAPQVRWQNPWCVVLCVLLGHSVLIHRTSSVFAIIVLSGFLIHITAMLISTHHRLQDLEELPHL